MYLFAILDRMMQSGRITPVKAPPLPKVQKCDKYEGPTSQCFHDIYTTSFLNQIVVLIKRTFLILSRNRTLTYSRIGIHIGIALFISILYRGIGQDASNMLNNFNFLFFSVMFLMHSAFNSVTTTCK